MADYPREFSLRSEFQKCFSFDEFYSAQQIREEISAKFLPGKQLSIWMHPFDHDVEFVGLAEVSFHLSEAAYRHKLQSDLYEDTHLCKGDRATTLENRIPESKPGFLHITEIDPSESRKFFFVAFEGTDLGYIRLY